MKQIENFYMGSLRNNEDYGFHTLVIKAINNLPPVEEGQTDALKATRENYIAQFTTFDRAYQQTKKLDEVETLEAADAEVDEAYSASRIFINVMRRHPDEAKRTFAEEVGRIYDKYEIPVCQTGIYRRTGSLAQPLAGTGILSRGLYAFDSFR